ncbi:PAS-domain containing protein [Chelativorans alearense]|uniref:PAS-domain containing protein n=1 Tax=Chelativorans alearense TaxID=2681495 RepID=UPI0013D04908|nr:PAS-domain containing protein [Chelativorans alearense]
MSAPAPAKPSRRDLESEMERLRRENDKLRTIRDALIRQVDRSHDLTGNSYKLFQSVTRIESSVEKRIQRLARAMSEAKIARRQLQHAIDSIGEGFILYDKDDRIVLCNRKYRKIFPELEDLLKPGTHFNDVIQRAAETGVIAEAVTDPQSWIAARIAYHRTPRCQFQQLLSDGRWIQISERATDEGGKVTVVSDITQFRRLEDTRRLSNLAQQSDILATTVASIAQGVIVFDAELNLVAWNSQASMLLNVPYMDMHAGTNVRKLLRLVWRHGATVERERREAVREWIRDVKRRHPLRVEVSHSGGRVIAANFRSMPDDGFVVTMTDVSPQINAAKLLERSNEELEKRVQERTRELTRLNEILQDEVLRHEKTMADLERTRKAAEAANLSKTRFLAAASHDLLQPLNAARLYLSALETSHFVGQEGHDLLDKLGNAFQSTEALLGTILDISKMDAGGYQPKLAAIDVGALLETLKAEFDALANQKGLRLRMVRSSAVVWSDAQLLRRIIQNFLSNAIKYTETGSILLGARHKGRALSIEIHDTGSGIPHKDREVIFEEFRRAVAPSSQMSGLGLGLAIVRRAADLLGHEVKLHSKVGLGSCFSVVVPLKTTGPQPQARQEQDGAGIDGPRDDGRPRTEGHLFVLENDESVAHAMTTLFSHWQIESVTAPSYLGLLDLVQHKALTPLAVVADLHLDGDIDGIDAIILLREHFGHDLPGILVTADHSRAITERARAKHIEYFSKPVKPAQLRAYLFHLSTVAGTGRMPAAGPMPGA